VRSAAFQRAWRPPSHAGCPPTRSSRAPRACLFMSLFERSNGSPGIRPTARLQAAVGTRAQSGRRTHVCDPRKAFPSSAAANRRIHSWPYRRGAESRCGPPHLVVRRPRRAPELVKDHVDSLSRLLEDPCGRASRATSASLRPAPRSSDADTGTGPPPMVSAGRRDRRSPANHFPIVPVRASEYARSTRCAKSSRVTIPSRST